MVHVASTREDVELVLRREGQESDELLAAQRRNLARRSPLACLRALHAQDRRLEYWVVANIDDHVRREAAMQIQARWRTRPMTPASNLRLSGQLTLCRVNLRKRMQDIHEVRRGVEAEALGVFQRAAPPLANRITVLRRRLSESAYRSGRDTDAGTELPRGTSHPIYEMVRVNQEELLDDVRQRFPLLAREHLVCDLRVPEASDLFDAPVLREYLLVLHRPVHNDHEARVKRRALDQSFDGLQCPGRSLVKHVNDVEVLTNGRLHERERATLIVRVPLEVQAEGLPAAELMCERVHRRVQAQG